MIFLRNILLNLRMISKFKPNRTDLVAIIGLMVLTHAFFYTFSWYFQLIIWPSVFFFLALKYPNLRIKKNSYELRRKPLQFTQTYIFIGYFIMFCLLPLRRETEPILIVFKSEPIYTLWLVLLVFFIRHFKIVNRTVVFFDEYYLYYYANKKHVQTAFWEIDSVQFENTEVKIKLHDSTEITDSYLEISDEQKSQIQEAFENYKNKALSAAEFTIADQVNNKKVDRQLTTVFIGISLAAVIWIVSKLF